MMRYLLLLVSTPTPCSTCGSPQPGPVTVYEGVEAALLEVEHLDVAAALQWVQVQSGVTWHDSHLVSLDSEEQSSPVQGQTLPEENVRCKHKNISLRHRHTWYRPRPPSLSVLHPNSRT